MKNKINKLIIAMVRLNKKLPRLFFKRLRLKLGFLLSLTAFFLFAAMVAAPPALAQNDPLALQVKQGLQDLSVALGKLQTLLNTATACANRDVQEAVVKLRVIDGLRKEAESKYNRALNSNDGRMREALLNSALGNIRDAKARLEEVELAIKRAADALLNNLGRLRNNFDELMRRAEQIVIGSGNRQAERRLQQAVQQARKIQSDAERAALSGNPCHLLNAATAYGRAITLLMEALRLVEGDRPTPETTPEAIIAREKERFDNILARALEAVDTSKNSAARPVLEQAQKQARAAEEAFRKGKIVLAQQLYRGAVRLLLRTIDLAAAGQPVHDGSSNDVALLEDLIQTAEQEIKDNMTPREALLLERARILVDEAKAALERRQPQEARWRLELARNLIDKVMRKAGRNPNRQENLAQHYDEALRELAQDIADMRAKARQANQPEALQLVELAAAVYQAAENAGQQNQPARLLPKLHLALQMIRTAQYFLLRAETLLRGPSAAPAPAREDVVQYLAQLNNSIQELRQAPQPNEAESCQAVTAQALELSARAQAALERGETRLALAIIEVAKDLIEQCLKGR